MPKKRNPNELTGNELKLIELRLANPQATYEQLASMLRVRGKESIYAMLKRPRVEKAWQEACAKRTEAVIKAEAKRAIMGRREVILKLQAIAEDPESKRMEQIAALREMKDILGLVVKRVADVSAQHANRSEEELEFFAQYGYYPDMDPGRSSSPKRESERPRAPKPDTLQ